MEEAPEGLGSTQELSVRVEYENRRSQLEAIASNIRLACEGLLRSNGLPYHLVKSRIKSLSSSLEKITRKKYEPSISAVEDLVGLRIICLYPRHIDPILALLRKEFSVQEEVDKRPGTSPDRFGYSSVHLTCSLSGTPRANLPEYAGLQDIPFEIQVRTILQEAWAEIEHQLVYKSRIAAPNEIKRLIVRLSGSLEIADEQFQQVYDLRQAYIDSLKEVDTQRLSEEPLNIDSLLEFIRRRYTWSSEWEKSEEVLVKELAMLLNDIHYAGVTTLEQLAPIIEKWKEVVAKESERLYRQELADEDSQEAVEQWQRDGNTYFTPVGLIRRSLKKEFPHLEKDLWGKRRKVNTPDKP